MRRVQNPPHRRAPPPSPTRSQDLPLNVDTIRGLTKATALFGLTDAATAKMLGDAADKLSRQPSVLGKLVFLAERAMPMPASMAKLRTKFPNWSFDTVTALQRAMVENIFRQLVTDGTPPDADALKVLGLSDADASRLTQEVKDAEAEEERKKAEALAEEEDRARLQRALESAAGVDSDEAETKPTSPPSVVPPIRKTRFDNLPPSSPPSPPEPEPQLAGDGGDPPEVGESGTHEYECTKCGYVIFPAKGREFKFFGASFECPQCGAGKDAFVDNGPVDD